MAEKIAALPRQQQLRAPQGYVNAGLPLVVRTLKREVRAFGGCLGMQRR